MRKAGHEQQKQCRSRVFQGRHISLGFYLCVVVVNEKEMSVCTVPTRTQRV